MNVAANCTPRPEVLHGEMDDAVFAASLVELVSGTAKPVYSNAETFFANTHPAAQLCDTARRVFRHLSDPTQGGVFIRLSTGFGGGKTHALMTLWHLAQHSGNGAIGAEIVAPAGRPGSVHVVAVDIGAAGAPNFKQHGAVTTHSLWGEVAFQLAGERGVAALGEGEALDRQPNLEEFRALFPDGPVLILLDELVMYLAGLKEIEQKGLLNFLNKLIGICVSRPQTALVLSDPATQAVYRAQSQDLAKAIAAQAADQITGRRATDIDPIGDESSAVIVRRLFERVDPAGAAEVAKSYHSLYERLLKDPSGRLVPDEAARDDYATRIQENYPFHPSLMRTVRDRLNTIPEFNSSRGTLRLFARIVRNTFERTPDVALITAGEIDWADPSIVTELLQRLNREAFLGAVSTDIGSHARELDGGVRGAHTRVASALLLESLTQEPNAGFAAQELTLAVARPQDAGHEPTDAMERLASQCWYTYRLDSGIGYQFRVEPNVNQMIAKRAPEVPDADALGKVHTEVQGYFQGPVFKVVPFPANARQVQDTAKLQLALCDSLEVARKVASLSNDEDPAAEQPRQFRNAIVSLAPSADPYRSAISFARRLKAAEAIQAEHPGESGKKIREQLKPVIDQLRRDLTIQSRRAFSNLVFADGQVRPIEEKFLVDEVLLSGNTGQNNLRAFLEQKNLIFRSGDKLDTDLYVTQVITGATPSVQNPGAYSGRSLHERLLSRNGMRLVPDEHVTRRSIAAGVEAGKLVARLADGSAYDASGAVVGAEGQRERKTGFALPPAFPLDDTTLVALAGEPVAEPWFATSDPIPPTGAGAIPTPPPPPPPPTATRTSSWAEAAEWAASGRLIKSLTLIATAPTAAATVVPLAGPLGANTLKLSVLCTGSGKNNGGAFRFAAENTGVNHPVQPLNTASTIYNSLEEAGRQFVVRLALDFASGRAEMATQLEQTGKAAAEGVTMEAEFAAGPSTQGDLI